MYLEEQGDASELNIDAKSSGISTAHSHLAQASTNGHILQTRAHADGPIIARFRAVIAELQSSELQRLYGRLPNLDAHSRAAIRQFADCLVAKVVHPPVECLRDEESDGFEEYLLKALERLFLLDK